VKIGWARMKGGGEGGGGQLAFMDGNEEVNCGGI
jgi:hypothetical protein